MIGGLCKGPLYTADAIGAYKIFEPGNRRRGNLLWVGGKQGFQGFGTQLHVEFAIAVNAGMFLSGKSDHSKENEKKEKVFHRRNGLHGPLNLMKSKGSPKTAKKFLHFVNKPKGLFTQSIAMSALNPQKFAVIDCGTNTFNLLVVEYESAASFKKIYSTRFPVKLGEGAINQGYIAPTPFLRGLSAIEQFVKDLKQYGVTELRAFATSAIRDAGNGPDFVNLVHEKYGIRIEVIDGLREAELIAQGVMAAVKPRQERALIMDIGGGSTEFIICEGPVVKWKQSFDLGVARLLERFKPSDPIRPEEVEALFAYLDLKLKPLWIEQSAIPCSELIGSSGAFDSLIEILHFEYGAEPLVETKTEYSISLEHYQLLSKRLRASSLEQRRHIRGLVAMRVDMIVFSCLLIDFVLDRLNLKQLTVSTYSLKEGAVAEVLRNKSRNLDPD